MTLVITVVKCISAKMVNIGIIEILSLGNLQHGLSVGSGKELSLVVKQLQGVPMAGIVTGRDDNAPSAPDMRTANSVVGVVAKPMSITS